MIQRAKTEKVQKILVVPFDPPTITTPIQLIQPYHFIYPPIPSHPLHPIHITHQHFASIKQLSHHQNLLPIPKITLDYYSHKSPKHVQKQVFT
ncbi:TatD family hydrolase, partial [Bacillus altitudinis]|uniref:TatD family hydrolase n=1 Tax=Bacillus altitudinis TaxID=293387 RepID=UPI003B52F816